MKYVITLFIILCSEILMYSQILAPGFQEKLLLDSLNPVSFTLDHHGRIWLIEKNGRVLIIDEDGTLNPDPFITIKVDQFNERGLLGIALHPDMDDQPYIYLYYTVPNANHNRVSRFTANGDLALPGSEEILLELDTLSGAIHNAGAMLFDSSGFLFIATGEAGLSINSQDTTNLLGKILRIHDDGTIPIDNPFYEKFKGKQRAIWSLGHRNPFNLSYDFQNHILYATDVGSGDYEEINKIEKGKNYGWPIIEGPITDQIPPPGYQDPLFAYTHNDGCAIVGLNLYQTKSNEIPNQYLNKLFFADYCERYIKVLNPQTGQIEEMFGENIPRPLHMEENHITGTFYYLGRTGIGGGSPDDNTTTTQGSLWEVSYTGSGVPHISLEPSDMNIPLNESATFTVRATGSKPLSYQWSINDTILVLSNDTLSVLNLNSPIDSSVIQVIVSNTEGHDTSRYALLRISNSNRPIAHINEPKSTTRFSAGDTIRYSGLVEDIEDGIIDSAKYNWRIDLHHNLHTHPFITEIKGVASGEFIIPFTGETDTLIWYRVILKATDNDHFVGQDYTDIQPELSHIQISGPSGAQINVDGRIRRLPYTFKSLKKLKRTILVPQKHKSGDVLYIFNKWSDNYVNNTREIHSADSLVQYTLLFDTLNFGNGNGLIASYYNDPEFDFDEEPALLRTDSVINFRWGNKSPNEDLINNDNFSARWQGFIKPLVAEKYRFTIYSDDGTRLWINNQLVHDDWTNHPPQRHQIDFTFDSVKLVPIKMEYFEKQGGAEVTLSWQSNVTPYSIVPRTQLYPIPHKSIYGHLWVDKNRNDIHEFVDKDIESAIILLFNAATDQLLAQSTSNNEGKFEFKEIQKGSYYILVANSPIVAELIPHYGISESGISPNFLVDLHDDVYLQIVYHDDMSAIPHESRHLIEKSVYPNPTSGTLFVECEEHVLIEQLELINTLGQKVFNRDQINDNRVNINVNHLPKGIYYLILKTNKQIFNTSIMKI